MKLKVDAWLIFLFLFTFAIFGRSGLKHRSHSTGQRYRSLFYRLVTEPNNSPQSKTEFWIVIRARRHFWACLFICSTATCTSGVYLYLSPVTCVLDPPFLGSFLMYRMQMKHIVEPLFVSHCILVQYCFLSFVSIILRHLCPAHQVRTRFWKGAWIGPGLRGNLSLCLLFLHFPTASLLSTVSKFLHYKALICYSRKTVFISSCCRTFTTIARPCSRAICELTSSSVGSLGSPISKGSVIISASFSLKRAMISGCESPSNFSCSSFLSSAILIFS